jgi:hypothetical protein
VTGQTLLIARRSRCTEYERCQYKLDGNRHCG